MDKPVILFELLTAGFANLVAWLAGPRFDFLSTPHRFLVIAVVTLLFFGFLYLLGRFIGKKLKDGLAARIRALDLSSLPELASKYAVFVREQYSVDVAAMPYEEQVVYLASHYFFLNRKRKAYFPEHPGMPQAAAMALLGETERARFGGDWIRGEDGFPVLETPHPVSGKLTRLDLFHMMIEAPFGGGMEKAIMLSCLCFEEKRTSSPLFGDPVTFPRGVDPAAVHAAARKYGIELKYADLYLNSTGGPVPATGKDDE